MALVGTSQGAIWMRGIKGQTPFPLHPTAAPEQGMGGSLLAGSLVPTSGTPTGSYQTLRFQALTEMQPTWPRS
jgi:hypothetical protein